MADKKPIASTPPSLVGAKLYLRPATAEDIANTHHWRVMQEPQLFSVYPEPIQTAGDAVEAFKKEGRSAGAQDFVMGQVGRTMETGELLDYDTRVIRPDGKERVIHIFGQLSYTEKGEPARLFGTIQDITERVAAEKALRKERRKIRFQSRGLG